jgi:hypothetical protein
MYGTPQFVRRGPGTYLTGAPLSSRVKSRRALSALDPVAAAKQIFPNAPRSSSPGHNMDTFNYIVSAAQDGFTDPKLLPALCSGGRPPGMAKPVVFQTTGGIAMKFAPTAFAAGPIVGGIVLAGAAILAVFGHIFGHHAAAVKKEQSVLCAAIPAAQDAMSVIDQAVSSGQVTPDQAIAALDNVVAGFRQAVAPIIHGADPTVSGECNAACVNLSQLRAAVLVKQSQYADLAAQQAAQQAAKAAADAQFAANPAVGVATALAPLEVAATSMGLPAWLVPAAGFLVLWKFL